MFLRFIAPLPDRSFAGVFQVGYRLRSDGVFADYEQEWFDVTAAWFNRELPVPDRFSRSIRPGAHENALCWFKLEAKEYISKIRELTALLEHHGIPTRMIRTTQPGYIVYEDRFQVAAVPYRDTVAMARSC